jgi:hypothetical protein
LVFAKSSLFFFTEGFFRIFVASFEKQTTKHKNTMKYVRRYLLILCALLTGLCLPSSLLGQNNNQYWSLLGSGTEADPFRIASTTDWDAFASDVNCGIDYSGKYISLTRDITVTTMVGDPTNTNAFFEGYFNGNGHTLTVHLSGDEAYIAPFRMVRNSAFLNLKVEGDITTSQKYAGGIVGKAFPYITFQNCHVAVTINSSVYGDGSHGGFVGAQCDNNSHTTFINCLFSGSILGEYTNTCAGFVGWVQEYNSVNAGVQLFNCLFDPTDITVSSYGSHPFARGDKDNVFLAIAYSGFKSNVLGGYTPDGYFQDWSTTDYEDILDTLNKPFLEYTAGNGWEMKDGKPVPKLGRDFNGAGVEADPYIINNTADWNLFCDLLQTNNFQGKYFKLTDDITITRMAGDSNHSFNGHFDGAGHTLNLNLTSDGTYTAPFRNVNGGTIMNLKVTGTVTTAHKFASGLVGLAQGGVYIEKCHVAVTITSSVVGDGSHGGLIGQALNGVISFTDCLFSGSLLGSGTHSCGGFIGWAEYDGNNNSVLWISSCLFDPTTITIGDGSNYTYARCRNQASSFVVQSISGYKTLFGTNNSGIQDWSGTSYETILTHLGNGWKMENNKAVPKMGNENQVAYVDLDGNTQYVNATAITDNELRDNWYVVTDAESYDDRISVFGHVNIILCDGATFSNPKGMNLLSGNSVTFWGQAEGTGTWNVTNPDANQAGIGCGTLSQFIDNSGVITINGGIINAQGGARAPGIGGGTQNNGSVIINRGTVHAQGGTGAYGISSPGSVNINGGQVDADGGMKAPQINLSWTNDSDYIESDSYDGTITLIKDFTEYNGTGAYHAGSINPSTIGGKRLVPHVHGNYTPHAAVTPSYNPTTGVYTDGWIEHYTCACGRYYIFENSTYIEVTQDDVLRPYFMFVKDAPSSAILVKYCGTDAEITIPNTVPAHYATGILSDSDVVTVIGQNAFKDNTAITKVTLGDNITYIGKKAFYGCTNLEEISIGTGLNTLCDESFYGCTSLVKFTCTATAGSISLTAYPFNHSAATVFYGMHEGSFRDAYDSDNFATGTEPTYTYIGLDRHDDPTTWTWSEEAIGATATFACSHCNYTATIEAEITSESIAGGGATSTATVIDNGGNTYTDTKTMMSYLALDGTTKYHEVTLITSDHDYLDGGWYAVNKSSIANNKRFIADGNVNHPCDVNIILCDGSRLSNCGMTVPEGTSLTVWGQSSGNGEWVTNYAQYSVADIYNAAGIGSASETDAGTITINGGTIKAWGAEKGAGIGGGYKGKGTVTINGGSVTATGGKGAAGIGGGRGYEGKGTVTINGGSVTANGGLESAGIGGGAGNGGTIIINGGSIQAIGGSLDETSTNSGGGAGIGGGFVCSSTNTLDITINGGTISATGTDGGAGIGSGRTGYSGATITINGGKVTANANTEGAAGIGRGKIALPENNPCSITLSWTDAANDTIQSSSYAGNVSLTKVFKTNDVPPVYLYGEINNLATIDGKVLTPYVVDKIFVTDGYWYENDNWVPSGSPSSSDKVVINAAVTITGEARVNTITLGAGGSITIDLDYGAELKAYNAVNATVKKPIDHYTIEQQVGELKTDGWYFIASPINSNSLDPSNVTNMLSNTFDLYRFNDAAELEWENWKQTGDHYHFNLEKGRGYLYANSNDETLEFSGEIIPYTGYSIRLSDGFNLVGNPYPFHVYANKPYYRMNSARNGVELINNNYRVRPCEAIMLEGTDNEYFLFTETQSSYGASNNGELHIAVTQQVINRGETSNIEMDKAIVSFNEGNTLSKFYFGDNAKLYIPQNGKDYAIVSVGRDGVHTVSTEIPVNFKAKENGTYTITVNTDHVEMSYLHLIDNMTGTDIDLLSPSLTPLNAEHLRAERSNPDQPATYTFTAKTTDYESRFRLVFSTVCEDADGDSDGTFAFISNGNIIINGEGTLQIMDVTGRIIRCTDGVHTVSTNGMTAGVYVLRLINGNDVKTQKVVIQ